MRKKDMARLRSGRQGFVGEIWGSDGVYDELETGEPYAGGVWSAQELETSAGILLSVINGVGEGLSATQGTMIDQRRQQNDCCGSWKKHTISEARCRGGERVCSSLEDVYETSCGQRLVGINFSG